MQSDIGPSQDYAFRAVGSVAGTSPLHFIRQSDGTYALGLVGEKKYWSAKGGGGNAPGGSDGNPIDYKDAIGSYERFKIIDQGNCTYAIQTAKGWYFGMKAGTTWNWNTFSTRISDPAGAPTIGYVAYWELVPTAL